MGRCISSNLAYVAQLMLGALDAVTNDAEKDRCCRSTLNSCEESDNLRSNPDGEADALDIALAVEAHSTNAKSDVTPVNPPCDISEDHSKRDNSELSLEESDLSSDSNNDDGDAADPPVAGGKVLLENENLILKTKNEVDYSIPQLPADYTIPADAAIERVGIVHTVGNCNVVIKATTSGAYRVLEENSEFCLQDRSPIGLLYETFGRVESPYYVVRFENAHDANKFAGFIGEPVFYVVKGSRFLLTSELRTKGSDASNMFDEEVPIEEQEFSNDEQEMMARPQKKRRRSKKRSAEQSGPDRRDQIYRPPVIQGRPRHVSPQDQLNAAQWYQQFAQYLSNQFTASNTSGRSALPGEGSRKLDNPPY